MNNEKLLKTTIAWLHEQISGMRYGETAIRVIVHDGQVTRIEKSIVQKEQAE
jgi:hypothetical protein